MQKTREQRKLQQKGILVAGSARICWLQDQISQACPFLGRRSEYRQTPSCALTTQRKQTQTLLLNKDGIHIILQYSRLPGTHRYTSHTDAIEMKTRMFTTSVHAPVHCGNPRLKLLGISPRTHQCLTRPPPTMTADVLPWSPLQCVDVHVCYCFVRVVQCLCVYVCVYALPCLSKACMQQHTHHRELL